MTEPKYTAEDLERASGIARNWRETPGTALEPAVAAALAAERAEAEARTTLFADGAFTAHSGGKLLFKIDCDALTDADLDTLAGEISRKMVRFGSVYGIPRGGVRLADALRKFSTGSPLDPTLIVDDVLTTGRSMEAAKLEIDPNAVGVVIFARGLCPEWITPLFVTDAALAEAEARTFERAAQWHEAQRPNLSGPEYGMAGVGTRMEMRDRVEFHNRCARELRAIAAAARDGGA